MKRKLLLIVLAVYILKLFACLKQYFKAFKDVPNEITSCFSNESIYGYYIYRMLTAQNEILILTLKILYSVFFFNYRYFLKKLKNVKIPLKRLVDINNTYVSVILILTYINYISFFNSIVLKGVKEAYKELTYSQFMFFVLIMQYLVLKNMPFYSNLPSVYSKKAAILYFVLGVLYSIYSSIYIPIVDIFSKNIGEIQLQEDYKNELKEICKTYDFNLENIRIYETMPYETLHPYIFFTIGWGNFSRIYAKLSSINNMTPKMFGALIMHELQHCKDSVGIKYTFLQIIEYFITFCVRYVFYFTLFFENTFFGGKVNTNVKFVIYDFINRFILEVYQILVYKVYRHYEYKADLFAAENGYEEFVMPAFGKMMGNLVTNLDCDPLYSIFYQTHPTMVQRNFNLVKKIK